MLSRDEAQKIKKMVDELEDLYYNLGRDYVTVRDGEACAASHAFVEYVDSLRDPEEVIIESIVAYNQSTMA